jgi:hypothetical protein
MLPVAQPPSQREQRLLTSPEFDASVDVNDRKRASIFSFLRGARIRDGSALPV